MVQNKKAVTFAGGGLLLSAVVSILRLGHRRYLGTFQQVSLLQVLFECIRPASVLPHPLNCSGMLREPPAGEWDGVNLSIS